MKQAIMQDEIYVTKAAIMAVREIKNPVNTTKPVPAVSKSGPL